MLAQKLKQSTLEAHQALEKRLITVIKRIRTTADYADLLKMMYGYYFALETKIQKHLMPINDLNFQDRRKALAIKQDVERLEESAVLPVCKLTTRVDSPARALGAMYVLEGSTLGGVIIAKMIKSQLNMDTSDSFTFFGGYGEHTQKMWSEFKANLDGPYDEQEQNEIIDAADETFKTFKTWIDTYAAN